VRAARSSAESPGGPAAEPEAARARPTVASEEEEGCGGSAAPAPDEAAAATAASGAASSLSVPVPELEERLLGSFGVTLQLSRPSARNRSTAGLTRVEPLARLSSLARTAERASVSVSKEDDEAAAAAAAVAMSSAAFAVSASSGLNAAGLGDSFLMRSRTAVSMRTGAPSFFF